MNLLRNVFAVAAILLISTHSAAQEPVGRPVSGKGQEPGRDRTEQVTLAQADVSDLQQKQIDPSIFSRYQSPDNQKPGTPSKSGTTIDWNQFNPYQHTVPSNPPILSGQGSGRGWNWSSIPQTVAPTGVIPAVIMINPNASGVSTNSVPQNSEKSEPNTVEGKPEAPQAVNPQMDLSFLTENKDYQNAYLKYATAYLESGEDVLEQRKRAFETQYWVTNFIFLVTHVILFLAIYVSYREFKSAEKNRAQANEQKESEIQLSLQGIALKTSRQATIILVAAIGFYFMYIKFVYPIDEI
ncbi:hypothetical protein Pan153_36240 [Gimesia panareensis]|uniref:Uncharacterized protein n=1 Tax=Gimesia panareensis TaxID=2527978 RepID=A0A518FRI1_9PLAN|nr:hypothetical protein [Gimesia panareensis]QDV18963.1 hypothetical protein Pan153_36240 [Gimesia panareensis]